MVIAQRSSFIPAATDLTQLVGNTPLVRLNRVVAGLASGVEIYGKAEYFNPGGSVKDRPALHMILQGERSGELTPEKTLLDATSGNTGIAYAWIAAARGYQVKLALPLNASEERKRILKAYGVDLVLTDPAQGSDGAILKARELYAAEPERYFYPDQYSNPNNWRAHYLTTGIEIYEQTQGRVTHFVTGLGTSGTCMGVGRRLHEYNPAIQVLSMQPDSPFHGLEGLKHMETAIVPPIYDPSVADTQVEVSTEAAQKMVKRLAREEGLLVGISAGANVVAALRVAQNLTEGVVVTVLCDSADKYLSERFWDEP
ncbi:PLP-dependent cysteine synthase family protein [Anthocerotibacter panamensis]|uniref:PLP-dependent cysteine synthase family protein n=1 Tax=Anthocerotibacter panamensis TaxID=2857077 RepID=UPI001C401E6E